MVPQVDKKQMAVVALAMHPARQPNLFADIAEAKPVTAVGTVGVHREVGPFDKKLWRKVRAALQWGKGFCQAARPPLKPRQDSCVFTP